MAVTIGDGKLEWSASIDLSDLKAQVKELNNELAKAGKSQSTKVDDVTKFYEKQVDEIKLAQERMTKIIKDESKQRIDASRKEAEEWLKSGLPIQTTGTKAKYRYEFGVPVKTDESFKEIQKTIRDAASETRALDEATKEYIEELVQLELQQSKLKAVQKELNSLNKEGKVSQEQYIKGTEQIAGAQKALADDIKLIGERQKEVDALKLAEIDSTKAQIAQVERLKEEYMLLSQAQKDSAYGKDLDKQIVGLNTSIKQTQVQLNRTAEVAQKSGTAVTRFFGGAWSYLRQIAYVLPGFGIAGIISGIASALSNLIFGSGGFERAVERIKNAMSGLSDEQIKTRKAVDQAASSYTGAVVLIGEMEKNIKMAKAGFVDKDGALKSYNDTLGKTFGFTNDLNKAEKNLIDKGEAYIKMQLQKAVATAALEEAAKKAFEVEKMRMKQEEEFLTTGDKFATNAARNAYAMGGPLLQEAANKTADQMRKEMAKKRKEEAEKEAQDEVDIYKKIFEKAQSQAAQIAKAFKINFFDKDERKEEKKAQEELNKLLEKREEFLKTINDLERDAKQSGLIQREKEIDKINEKYDKQLQVIKELNEAYRKLKPKDAQLLVTDAETERVNAARNIEIANYNYREDAKNYLDSLEEKKAAFEQLQKVMQDGSIEQVEFARSQYRQQVGQFDSYVDYLRSQIAALTIQQMSGVLDLGSMLKLEGLKEELTKAMREASDANRSQEIESLNSLLSTAETYTAKKAGIERKYTKLYATLEKQRTQISEKEYQDRIQALRAAQAQEAEEAANIFLQQNKSYKEFQNGFEDIGIRATRSIINGLKKLREEMKAAGADLTEINKAINSGEESLSSKQVSSFRELAGIMSSIGSDLNMQLTKTLRVTGQQIAQIISSISNLFDANASKTSQAGSLVGLITMVVVGIRDAMLTAEDMADPLQDQKDAYAEIGNEIEANNFRLRRQLEILEELTGAQKINAQAQYLDDLKKKQDDALKSLQDFQVQFIKSSREVYVDPLGISNNVSTGGLNALADLFLWGGQAKRKIQYELETIDTSSFNTIEDFAELLAEIKRGGGKLNGKVVIEEDIKALELLIQTYDDAVAEQRQLRDQLMQVYTATTSNAIADSIVEGFKAGKRSMEDFTDDFHTLMRNAVLNSLKYRFLETPLQNFYEEFAKKSASDSILTSHEIEDLSSMYKEIIDAAAQQYENLGQITGIDLSGNATVNALAGAIKGITEDQADLLAGQFGGLRMTAAEQLQIAKGSLDTLQQIERNTSQILAVRDIMRDFQINGLKVK